MWYIKFMAMITGGTPFGIVVVQLVLAIATYWLCRKLLARRWLAALLAYLTVGWWTVALPMSVLVPATNIVGALYLTVLWPVWLYGNWAGFNVLTVTPEWLAGAMFSFT